MKHSPLCARDDGREVYFTFAAPGRKLRVTLPAAMLDSALGATAEGQARKVWVKENMDTILTAAVTGGATAPFDRVLVEEIG